jgi:DNA polymerase-3 subunit delta'
VISRISGNQSGSKKIIKIDQIRDIEHSLNLGPYEGRNKVFIIDGSEHLNQESANALLKILEEPPPSVFIILLAVDETSLPSTIISRCQIVKFSLPSSSVIKQALEEQWKVPSEKAGNLAQISNGSIGWAISACLDEGLLLNRQEILDKLMRLADAGLNERFTYAAELAGKYSKSQDEAEEIFDLWTRWWEDLLLISGRTPEFIVNVDYKDVLLQQARRLNLAKTRNFIEALQLARKQLKQNANPQLVFEVLMLSFPKRGV